MAGAQSGRSGQKGGSQETNAERQRDVYCETACRLHDDHQQCPSAELLSAGDGDVRVWSQTQNGRTAFQSESSPAKAQPCAAD